MIQLIVTFIMLFSSQVCCDANLQNLPTQLKSTSDFMRDRHWIIRFKLTPSEYDRMESVEIRVPTEKLNIFIANQCDIIVYFYLLSNEIVFETSIQIDPMFMNGNQTESVYTLSSNEIIQLRQTIFDTTVQLEAIPESIFEYYPNEDRPYALIHINQIENDWTKFRSEQEQSVAGRVRRSSHDYEQCGPTYPNMMKLEMSYGNSKEFQIDIRSCINKYKFSRKTDINVKEQFAFFAKYLCSVMENAYEYSTQTYQYFRSTYTNDQLFCVPDVDELSKVQFFHTSPDGRIVTKRLLIKINKCVCL